MACMICIEWDKDKITRTEAQRNLGEMVMSTDNEEEVSHYYDIWHKIMDDGEIDDE